MKGELEITVKDGERIVRGPVGFPVGENEFMPPSVALENIRNWARSIDPNFHISPRGLIRKIESLERENTPMARALSYEELIIQSKCTEKEDIIAKMNAELIKFIRRIPCDLEPGDEVSVYFDVLSWPDHDQAKELITAFGQAGWQDCSFRLQDDIMILRMTAPDITKAT